MYIIILANMKTPNKKIKHPSSAFPSETSVETKETIQINSSNSLKEEQKTSVFNLFGTLMLIKTLRIYSKNFMKIRVYFRRIVKIGRQLKIDIYHPGNY